MGEGLSIKEIAGWLDIPEELILWYARHGVMGFDVDSVRIPLSEVERLFPADGEGKRSAGEAVLEAEVSALKSCAMAMARHMEAFDKGDPDAERLWEVAERRAADIKPIIGAAGE